MQKLAAILCVLLFPALRPLASCRPVHQLGHGDEDCHEGPTE